MRLSLWEMGGDHGQVPVVCASGSLHWASEDMGWRVLTSWSVPGWLMGHPTVQGVESQEL